MTETKTETLSDVLRSLSELCPERFKIETYEGFYWLYVDLDGIRYPIGQGDDVHSGSLVLSSCMEECEARGWLLRIESAPLTGSIEQHYSAWIWGNPADEPLGESGLSNSPALALATALRDAIQSEVNHVD